MKTYLTSISVLLALGSLALTGCNDAKSPTGTAPSATAKPTEPKFSEPGLTAKIIDRDTQQPLPGVIVYGYYATVEGSLGGGESIAEVVRTFEFETDASGVFSIPAWNSGDRIIKGEPRSRFPIIGIYKPGYQTEYKTLGSLRQFTSNNATPGLSHSVKNNVYDFTTVPYLLTPAKTEKERYAALRDSGDGVAFVGECGWEQHVKLLMATHEEWMNWYQRNVPAKDLDANGYPKGTMTVPPELQRYSFVFETAVDNLIHTLDKSPEKWKCANPRIVFKRGTQ